MTTAIVWFRRDLRLADNPALVQATRDFHQVIPLYIDAEDEAEAWAPGGASRWWLHHSLASLDAGLRALGSRLVIRRGPSLEALRSLIRETGASAVFWNRRYEPASIARDSRLKQLLADQGLEVQSFNAALLNEPWQVLKADDSPYKVFTPYWKACLGRPEAAPLARPRQLPPLPAGLTGLELETLGLLPAIAWDHGFYEHWTPGETGAQQALESFLQEAVANYDEERNRPDRPGTSRLSPHLVFGDIGPRQIVAAINRHLTGDHRAGVMSNAQSYVRELYWREFAHQLLYHFPATPASPLDERFLGFPWRRDYADDLAAWQRGQTGVPLVDAGMRELWTTGWMHNRVRMVVASYLTKNLLIPWQEGARWFWDTLVDADLANNTLGWQWTAGCGADAAPYFRVFNPVLQGEKFDPTGEYVKRWCPELARLPAKFIHKPWEMPKEILALQGVRLGQHYPLPRVDLAKSRDAALASFETIKNR